MTVRKQLDALVNFVFLRDGRSQIIYGNGSTTSTTKGHQRCPLAKLYTAFERNTKCTIVGVNEFRTTILCNICFQPMVISKSPDRYQYCSNKSCVLNATNRDENVAKIIATVGMALNFGAEMSQVLPQNFKRAIKLVKAKPKPRNRRKKSEKQKSRQKELKKIRKRIMYENYHNGEERLRLNL